MIKYYILALAIALITGCAHPINVTPKTTELKNISVSSKNKSFDVGYYISPQDRSLEVTTLAGGGDNVRYFPYRDIEQGYQVILANTFKTAVALNSTNITESTEDLDFILSPKIITTSGSTGFFTWPPTNFSVDLTSTIKNKSGKIIAEPRVVGTGVANTSERLSEYGIAGIRAMEDALLKMQEILVEIDLSDDFISSSRTTSEEKVSERLKNLNLLKEQGLINEKEYNEKRQKILDAL